MSVSAENIKTTSCAFSCGRPSSDILTLEDERIRTQMFEIVSVMKEADAIEDLFRSQNLPLPTVYNLFTAGFSNPDTAKQIGSYGETAFVGFPRPDIYGHAGTVSTENNKLYLNGRAHPNEWSAVQNGAMVIAHPLQVLKELARRQRAKEGIDPLFVFTYLTGVREGHSLKPGDIGLILDDTELTNIVHPGHGARAILDQFLGSHFQPKAGRASNLKEAKSFADFAKSIAYNRLFPAVVCGTPGTTEYQSFLEVGLLDGSFEKAKDNLAIFAEQIFGNENSKKLSLLYGMGITSELATMRQTFPGEPDFKVLAFGLATDSVGGSQSLTIDHNAVVEAAIGTGNTHRDMILQYENQYNAKSDQSFEDFSIRTKLQQ